MVINVKPLTSDLVDSFNTNLREDPLTNFLYLLDLHDSRERKKSEFYLALRDDRIEGKLVIYRGMEIASVWIRGNEEAASRLLEAIAVPDRAIFTVDRELGDVIRRRLSIRAEYPTEVMVVRTGEHRVFVKHEVEHLREEHAINYLRLFREYQPSLGTIKKEEIQKFRGDLEKRDFHGIFVNGTLVSTTILYGSPASEDIRWIGFTFTKEGYRGRGFATSTVSRAVSDAFQNSAVRNIGLMVRSTNAPAKHVYGKIGFKKHSELAWLNYNTDMAP